MKRDSAYGLTTDATTREATLDDPTRGHAVLGAHGESDNSAQSALIANERFTGLPTDSGDGGNAP
jgi:hypothetical protein